MKGDFLKVAISPLLLVAIAALALTILAGCGIGHGPHRHGYSGQYNYRGGYGCRNGPHYAPEFNSDNTSYGPIGGVRP